MKYSVVLLPKARMELLKAWEWYEERQEGLGDRFKDQVFNCIRIIELHPERYPERKKNYREALIKVFPYLLIYKVRKKDDIIAILSVYHAARNPQKKYSKK